jgi:hypothetical protein
MKSLGFGRYALSGCVATVLLTACGGSQPPIGAAGAMPQSRAIATYADRGGSWMLPKAKHTDLLYAADAHGGVFVFTYPNGKKVETLAYLYTLGGICSDTKGNVFVPALVGSSASTIYEFAHGGTSPIATLSDPPTAKAADLFFQTRSNIDEELRCWPLYAAQLRACGNADWMRRIAAADRRAGRRAANDASIA